MPNLRNILLTKAYICFTVERIGCCLIQPVNYFQMVKKNYLNVIYLYLCFLACLSNFLDLSKTHNAHCRRGAHPSFDQLTLAHPDSCSQRSPGSHQCFLTATAKKLQSTLVLPFHFLPQTHKCLGVKSFPSSCRYSTGQGDP